MFLRSIILAFISGVILSAQFQERRIIPLEPEKLTEFEKQAKVAILVGVGQYPTESGLRSLQYPVNDVDILGKELTQQGYKVILLKDGEAKIGSILNAIRQAQGIVDRSQGTIFFFFSGHGFAEKGTDYLAPYDAFATDLDLTGLSLKILEDRLKGTGAPRQVVMIDACRNEASTDNALKKIANETFGIEDSDAAGMRILLSTGPGQTSVEDDRFRNGIFTHFLAKGLEGEAAGTDGLITFDDLARFVTTSVREYAFSINRLQVPYITGQYTPGTKSERANFLIAKAPGAPEVLPPVPDSTGQAHTTFESVSRHNRRDLEEYVWIPAGKFMMGCIEGKDPPCKENERPQHAVTITKGFWMGRTEVEVAAYKRFVAAEKKTDPKFSMPKGPIWDPKGSPDFPLKVAALR